MSTPPIRVVHVIQQLSGGGAARVAVAQAAGGRRLGDVHTIASLLPPDTRGSATALAAGVPVTEGHAAALSAAQTADVVQVHFWNSPELYEFIGALTAPARVALLCQVAGDTAPHVLTRALVEWANCVIAGCPYTATLPVLVEPQVATRSLPPQMIWSTIGFERLRTFERQPHERFTIGYIGTVDFGKMHPAFVELHADPALAAARVIVCGSGDGFRRLERVATRLGVSERFEFRGYVDDIGAVLAACDVFGYPLRPGASSGAELVLQEAMYCGVPAVVLAHGGTQTTVQHGHTGLVVPDEASYTEAVIALSRDAALTARLGTQAAAFARHAFVPDRSAVELKTLYRAMVQNPRSHRKFDIAGSGAGCFVESLGVQGAPYRLSLVADSPGSAETAEETISEAPPQVVDAASGGILHYRRAYPADPHLRLWAGLVLRAAGRRALAAAEFKAATTDPRTAPRAARYLAETLSLPATTADAVAIR